MLLAPRLHARTRIMADTIDGAEDTVDRWQNGINAADRLTQTTVVVDQFSAVRLCNFAKMRHLAIPPADIEKAANTGAVFSRTGTHLKRSLLLRFAILFLSHGLASNPVIGGDVI